MSVNLGRVAYVEKGKYKSDTTYENKDVVSFNGGSYVFIGDAPAANVPPTDEVHWQPLIDPTAMNEKIAEMDGVKQEALTAAATASEKAEEAATAANTANTAAEAADNARLAISDELNKKAPAIFVDASGDMVHITDGAEGMPVQSLVTHIAPVQSGSGDPSPVNVRLIHGWNSVKMKPSKKNLFPGGTYTFVKMQMIYFNPPLPAGTYTLSAEATSTDTDTTYCRAYFDHGGVEVVNCQLNRNGRQSASVTTPKSIDRIRLMASTYSSVSEGDSATWKDVQLELGATATAYETYVEAQVLTDDLPETVYGGTHDWKTGVLVSDWTITNLGDYEWKSEGNGLFWANVIEGGEFPAGAMVCSAYKVSAASNHTGTQNQEIWARYYAYGAKNVIIRNTAYTDASVFKAALDGVMLAYKTGTPKTYQLTPQQLSTYKGTNNIWSDAGQTEVTYAADTKLYADGKDSTAMIGTAEPGMIATKNYASGDFIVVGKSLYKASAPIATGETITPGTNCTATTVVEQLAAIYNLIK